MKNTGDWPVTDRDLLSLAGIVELYFTYSKTIFLL